MEIQIGHFDFTEVWDGVLYKKLSRYPAVTDWEIRTLIEFADYERSNGRACTLTCEDEALLRCIEQKMQEREKYLAVPRPELITECTACRPDRFWSHRRVGNDRGSLAAIIVCEGERTK